MKKILVLLSLCVLTETLTNDNIVQSNKELILNSKLKPANNNFFGILLVPCTYVVNVHRQETILIEVHSFLYVDIICFFAATGIWPHFPQYMQSSVNEMGQQIFSQSDEHIRNFCKGKFLFNAQHSYKPSTLAYRWTNRHRLIHYFQYFSRESFSHTSKTMDSFRSAIGLRKLRWQRKKWP